MSLLRPLLLDMVPTIQQTAALALGKLANYNDDLAEAVVKGDILPQLVYSLAEQNVRLKIMSYMFLLLLPLTFKNLKFGYSCKLVGIRIIKVLIHLQFFDLHVIISLGYFTLG